MKRIEFTIANSHTFTFRWHLFPLLEWNYRYMDEEVESYKGFSFNVKTFSFRKWNHEGVLRRGMCSSIQLICGLSDESR